MGIVFQQVASLDILLFYELWLLLMIRISLFVKKEFTKRLRNDVFFAWLANKVT